MNEHSIFFNSDMVRALLDGRKTQFRRSIGLSMNVGTMPNHEGRINDKGILQFRCPPESIGWSDIFWGNDRVPKSRHCKAIKCPYGQVGDRLWVRESYVTQMGREGYSRGRYNADAEWFEAPNKELSHPTKKLGMITISNILMPKWAARIWLEITAIRVERVQDISEEDERAEGIVTHPNWKTDMPKWGKGEISISFASLWDSIYKKRGYGWEVNPWVWAIDFKRVEKE